MPGRKNRNLPVPQPGVDGPPMDQHHRRSLPRVAVTETEAINGDVRHLSKNTPGDHSPTVADYPYLNLSTTQGAADLIRRAGKADVPRG